MAGAAALRMALDLQIGGEALLILAVFACFAAGCARLGFAARRCRARAQDAARRSEQRYAAVFEQSPFAMVLTQMPRETVVEVNDAMLRLLGYRRDEVLGRTTVDLGLTPSPAYAAMTWELDRRGSVHDFECVRRTSSTTEVQTFAISMRWVTLPAGRHALTAIRDITEQRRLEDELRKVNS
jgi:PAS domain S-box-containing protein